MIYRFSHFNLAFSFASTFPSEYRSMYANNQSYLLIKVKYTKSPIKFSLWES